MDDLTDRIGKKLNEKAMPMSAISKAEVGDMKSATKWLESHLINMIKSDIKARMRDEDIDQLFNDIDDWMGMLHNFRERLYKVHGA